MARSLASHSTNNLPSSTSSFYSTPQFQTDYAKFPGYRDHCTIKNYLHFDVSHPFSYFVSLFRRLATFENSHPSFINNWISLSQITFRGNHINLLNFETFGLLSISPAVLQPNVVAAIRCNGMSNN